MVILMLNNWYKNIIKEANEFLGADGLMSPEDINATVNIKANGLSPWTNQSLDGFTTDTRHIEPNTGIRVSKCGDEPGGNGCGRDFSDGGCKWKGYSVYVNGEPYEAYSCYFCKHELKSFDIRYTKKPSKRHKDKRKKKRVKRLSQRITLNSFIKEAASPAIPSTYNNSANQMEGRLDLSEDQRVIPWNVMQDSASEEYDETRQKNNKDFKIIKIKDKNGKSKYIKIDKKNIGGNGVSQSNTYNHKGRRRERLRYKPDSNVSDHNPGYWAHNRDDNQGPYNMYIDKNRMNSDLRERAIPWDQYIGEKGLSGLSKPY